MNIIQRVINKFKHAPVVAENIPTPAITRIIRPGIDCPTCSHPLNIHNANSVCESDGCGYAPCSWFDEWNSVDGV